MTVPFGNAGRCDSCSVVVGPPLGEGNGQRRNSSSINRSTFVDRAVGGCADSDRNEAVVEAHFRVLQAEDGVAEPLVLDIARSVVEAFVLDRLVVDLVSLSVPDPVLTSAPDVDDILRNQGFDLALLADDAQHFLVLRCLSEHAQVEHAAAAIVEVDDDEGVIEDVWHLAVVDLVEVVDVLSTGGKDPLGVPGMM